MPADLSHNLHLLWRAGFGPAAEDLTAAKSLDRKTLYKQLVKNSTTSPAYLKVSTGTLDGLMTGIQMEGRMQELSREQKQQVRRQNTEALKDLNLIWLSEMVDSKAQFREKMAFFWHGHFQDGDLKYKVDFKNVYATILSKWLGADDKKILGSSYAHLDFI